MNKLTQDIILVAVVIAGLTSFFYNPLGENMEYIRDIMAAIVGFLIKEPITNREIPLARGYKK